MGGYISTRWCCPSSTNSWPRNEGLPSGYQSCSCVWSFHKAHETIHGPRKPWFQAENGPVGYAEECHGNRSSAYRPKCWHAVCLLSEDFTQQPNHFRVLACSSDCSLLHSTTSGFQLGR